MQRPKARRLALQGLCCLDVQGESALALVETFIRDSRESPEIQAEACRMLRAAFAARATSDALLEGESYHWNVHRMALVDRNILRLALWEMAAEKTPHKVVITEALRLAQDFSSAESSRFINGVLDAAARRLENNSRDAGDAGDKVV